ncbi:hypothetical protein [Mycoplasmopsis felis]|uniref:hypothetical protein n=1 Tax=Mycoplasmopsis felis TaxID=33923 RepID=UPI003A5C843F
MPIRKCYKRICFIICSSKRKSYNITYHRWSDWSCNGGDLAKKSRTITKEELTSVAYHEAGHAVVGLKVPGGNKVQKITIIPRGQAGGYNLMILREWKI